MTKIKLCGLKRPCEIQVVNELCPEYIGFVFVSGRRRYVAPEQAAELKKALDPGIQAVGVFIDEKPEVVGRLLETGVIEIAQLHGNEDEAYIRRLRTLSNKPVIKAFRMDDGWDAEIVNGCSADYVLLDSGGGGTGMAFDWSLAERVRRPYFLAGGLGVENVGDAVRSLHPYAVDVSSGIETDGCKDPEKMAAFVAAVRKEDRK